MLVTPELQWGVYILNFIAALKGKDIATTWHERHVNTWYVLYTFFNIIIILILFSNTMIKNVFLDDTLFKLFSDSLIVMPFRIQFIFHNSTKSKF